MINLSRIPGAQATQYKELARKLGEYRIIDENFDVFLVAVKRFLM